MILQAIVGYTVGVVAALAVVYPRRWQLVGGITVMAYGLWLLHGLSRSREGMDAKPVEHKVDDDEEPDSGEADVVDDEEKPDSREADVERQLAGESRIKRKMAKGVRPAEAPFAEEALPAEAPAVEEAKAKAKAEALEEKNYEDGTGPFTKAEVILQRRRDAAKRIGTNKEGAKKEEVEAFQSGGMLDGAAGAGGAYYGCMTHHENRIRPRESKTLTV